MTSTFDLTAGQQPQPYVGWPPVPAQGTPAEGTPAREYPETRFRVGAPSRDERGLHHPMLAGPWMNGPDGLPTIGSLGVLVDAAVGTEIYEARPAGAHSVTAELSVDVIAPPPWTGDLTAHTRRLRLDATGGIAQTEVFDEAGRLAVTATGHCRFIPAGPGSAQIYAPTPPAAHGSLLETLGLGPAASVRELAEVDADGGGARLVMPANPVFENGGGTVHGGILMCVSELATAALEEPSRPERTASLRMNFLRPAVLDHPVTYSVRTMHRGRSLVVYRVTSGGPAGKPYTIATVTRSR